MRQKHKLLIIFLLSLIILGGGGYLYVNLLTANHEILGWSTMESTDVFPMASTPGFKSLPFRGVAKAVQEGEFDLRSEDVEDIDYYTGGIGRRGIAYGVSSSGNTQSSSYGTVYMKHDKRINVLGGGGALAMGGGRSVGDNSMLNNSGGVSAYSLSAAALFAPSTGSGIANEVLMDPGLDDDMNFLPVGDYLSSFLIMILVYGVVLIVRRKYMQ